MYVDSNIKNEYNISSKLSYPAIFIAWIDSHDIKKEIAKDNMNPCEMKGKILIYITPFL